MLERSSERVKVTKATKQEINLIINSFYEVRFAALLPSYFHNCEKDEKSEEKSKVHVPKELLIYIFKNLGSNFSYS